MSIIYDGKEIKEIVIAAAVYGIIKYNNLDKMETEEFIKKYGLEKYIEPDLATHCLVKQILDMIVD